MYWEEISGVWTNTEVDCAIKAGVGDDEVKVVVNKLQAEALYITNDPLDLALQCDMFGEDDNGQTGGGFSLTSATPLATSPCGITIEGGFIVLKTNKVNATEILATKTITQTAYSSTNIIYNPVANQVVLEVMDANNIQTTFFVNNDGSTFVGGTLDVTNDANFDTNVTIDGNITVENTATFSMNNGNNVTFGGANESLTFSRPGVGEFTIASRGNIMSIINNDSNDGITINTTGNNSEIILDASDGVKVGGTSRLHASKSTFRDGVFNGGLIDSEALKNLSEVVTADMAKYLDDTSSPVQIVGVDRIEGEFVQLTKPNCLQFAEDSNYSSADANPYRDLIDSGIVNPSNGQSYARLILVPTFFKTYNSAFGDNQIYAQHASNSTPTTWDVFLYLSGEGAFGTGAREDGAGGSLAMIMCDYSSINFSRQTL
jgi:hypothetical protein